MYKVYFEGVGGLGNCLYQLAYSFNYTDSKNIYLIENQGLIRGTRYTIKLEESKGIENFQHINYKNTFFKKINFISKIPEKYQEITKLHLGEIDKPEENIPNIMIKGYCQNVKFFHHNISKIVESLDFSNEEIKSYLKSEYGNITSGICICLRQGCDDSYYKRKQFLDKNYYRKCIEKIKTTTKDIKLYVISDIKGAWKNIIGLDNEYPAIEVNEKDIVQFYFSLNCSHYILSQSTFHLWIAYVAGELDSSKKFFYKDWGPSNYSKTTVLKNWTKIN